MPAARGWTRGRRPIIAVRRDEDAYPCGIGVTGWSATTGRSGLCPSDASRCLSRNEITQAPRELHTNGLIDAAAPPRSPNRRYRLVQ